MKAIFLAPLMLAGCAEVIRLPDAPVTPPAPAAAVPVARPAPVETARIDPAPRPVPARAAEPAPRPEPAPERPASSNDSADSSSDDSSDDSATELATGESVKGCKEGGWWGLVGRPKAAASIISEPKRVYTEGDSVTMDNNPDRTNIVVDEAGTIVEVSCG